MQPTNTQDPAYFHKVVDCQWACPAHTPVPEYIRLIAQQRYADAYMINWVSNVFPGILGRTCDRPCEPACRRGRVEEENAEQPEPVAICRLKRVAADLKDDVVPRMPRPAPRKNGKRVACVGAGPASLTVARDLAPLGYDVTVFDGERKAGGFMHQQIPRFRLPESVIDEETGYVFALGAEFKSGQRIDSMKALLAEGFDAVFVGSGAPRGRDLDIPGRQEAAEHIRIGIDWLASVSFGHVTQVGKRVIVLGGGNTAMDCCRSARRLGGEDVKVIVRSGFDEMKASPWEKEDAQHEGIPIINMHVPKAFVHEGGKLTGMRFEIVRAEYDEQGRRRLVPTGEPEAFFACDEVLIAVGQENAFPWIERDAGIEFDRHGVRVDDRLRTTNPRVFAAGDLCSAFKFTHAADAQARILLANALFPGRQKASRLVVPWCTFTDPEVAHVGLTAAQAEARGVKATTLTVALTDVDRCVLDGESEGFARVHLRRGTDTILGATIVGRHAGEMIAELALAMTAGLGLGVIGRTIHPYPTRTEAVRKLADAWSRTRLTPTLRRLFAGWLAWRRW